MESGRWGGGGGEGEKGRVSGVLFRERMYGYIGGGGWYVGGGKGRRIGKRCGRRCGLKMKMTTSGGRSENDEQRKTERVIDRWGVECIQREEVEDDLWIGSDLSRWFSVTRWATMEMNFGNFMSEIGLGFDDDDDNDSEEKSDLRYDEDEEFERELKLFSAATNFELIDENGRITPNGMFFLLITTLPAIILAYVASEYLAKSIFFAFSQF